MRSVMAGNFLPAWGFSLLILIVASLPGDKLDEIQKFPKSLSLRFFLSDPFMHFMVFGLLALLICRGYYRKSKEVMPFLNVIAFSIGYGAFIEVYQGVLPWRSFGLDDLFWNGAGVLFFVGLVWVGWRTEDGRRKTEDGRRKTEDGGRKTEDGRRRTEDGRRKTEDGRRKTEDSVEFWVLSFELKGKDSGQIHRLRRLVRLWRIYADY